MAHAKSCLTNKSIKYHKHRRQNEHNADRADDRASGEQSTDGADHIDLGVESHSKGCGKKAESAGDDGKHGCLVGDPDGFPFCIASDPLFLVPAGHEDGIIHSRAELYGSDDDAGHKRELLSHIIRDRHVDTDGKLDDCHQYDRQ